MLALFIVIVAVLAALAGYLIGVRRRPARAHGDALASVLAPPAAAAPVAKRQADKPPQMPVVETSQSDRFGEEKARIIRSRDAEAAMLRRKLDGRDAAISQLEDFARERERLFGELAQAHAETARYRQLILDIENNAPPPILSGAAGPDDLKLIVGIGPVLERMLHTLGVTTFRQIAYWSERDIAEFDARLPEFPGRIVRDQWVTQARELHQSKYGEALDAPRSRG
jgi:predicted flap endonuclease-1-like 5' DNA nuclease